MTAANLSCARYNEADLHFSKKKTENYRDSH